MSTPVKHPPVAIFRRAIRRMPGLRKTLLRILRPVMPQIGHLVRWLEGGDYGRWCARWQATAATQDGAIRALVGDAAPLFLITQDTPSLETQVSLGAQVAVAWEVPANLTVAALEGRFVIHLAVGDRLARHALAEFALAARATPRPLILFADEDRQGAKASPWLKTAFDPDLLLQQAAFGDCVAYDAAFLAQHGLLELRGHALMLAAARWALLQAGPASIRHIPAILLHRVSGRSPAWRERTDRAAIAVTLAAAGEGVQLLPAGRGAASLPGCAGRCPLSRHA